jgi:hypothetical protein
MAAGSEDDTEDEWRFSLEELDDEAEPAESGVNEKEEDDEGGNIAGTLAHNQPLEPGDIDLENALFVVVGVLLVVGLIAATMLGL